MHPIGKYYKPKFIESADSMLKPIPGSDSCKANHTCYGNYSSHYLSHALNTHHNHVVLDVTSHDDNDVDRKDSLSSKNKNNQNPFLTLKKEDLMTVV